MVKFNCLICNEDIIYENESNDRICYFCKKTFNSQMVCKKGHIICDECHSLDAYNIITNYCLNTDSINPMEIVLDLMKHPSINMHGPEHHYLVPAALITAYSNKIDGNLRPLLNECQKRSKNILGGFCGYYGACGAAIGCGIYASIIQNSGPLDKKEWGLCNLITSKTLERISQDGGPRCCKRNSFHAITTAINFTKEYFNIELKKDITISCSYSNINKTCLKEKCHYFKKEN